MSIVRKLAALVAGVLYLPVLPACFGHEPTAQGRTLDQWLEVVGNPAMQTNVLAITALRSLGPEAAIRLAPLLESSDTTNQYRAQSALMMMGDQAVAAAPALVSILLRCGQTNYSDYRYDSVGRVSNVLPCLGYLAIPWLRPSLSSEQTRVREVGIVALERLSFDSAPGTMAELFKLLDDPSPKVRSAGAYVLGQNQRYRASAIPHLARLVIGDLSPLVRTQAALALDKYGSRDPDVRHAVEAIRAGVGVGAASSENPAKSDSRNER